MPEQPILPVPSPQSFGIEHFGDPGMRIALSQTFERQMLPAGAQPLPVWPHVAVHAAPFTPATLPVPGAQYFKYSRPFHLGKPEKPKIAVRTKSAPKSKKPGAKSIAAPKDPATTGSVPPSTPPIDEPPRPPRPIGHQLSVMHPPENVAPQ